MSAKDRNENFEVSSPCAADWESMIGNDRVRFCQHCNLSVHNLSSLTPKQALRLVGRSNGRLCVRYVLLPDGSIKTSRPPTLHRIGRHASRIAAGAFTASLTLSNAAATTVPFDRLLNSPRESFIESSLVVGCSIHGFIFDPNGAVITSAGVSIASSDGKSSLATVTSGDGEYRFAELEPGNYTLKIDARGFAAAEVTNIELRANHEDRIDQTLSIANVEAEVKVEGELVVQGGMAMPTPLEPLVRAAQMDDLDAVRELLAGKPNPNIRDKRTGTTALEHAVRNANREVIQLLLSAGVDVNLRDQSGRTALMMLGEKITPEIVWDLIHGGAKVSLRDEDGDTALMEAASVNNIEVLKILLDAGGKIDARNNAGETALMRAAADGMVNNVRTLIRAGAEVNARDKEGKTAWMYASDNEEAAVLRLLRSFGADETEEPPKENEEPQP